MARVPIYVEVKNDSTGAPVVGATATVKKRSDGTNATLYAAETGGTGASNPIVTDARGRALAWADPNFYNVLIAGTGVTSYTVPYDGGAPLVDGTVTTAALAAGAVTAPKVALAEKQQLGLNDGSQIGRGSFIQATAGTRASTSFGALTNGPDAVTGLVLPTAGFIGVLYHAIWQEATQAAANAAMFLGVNPVRFPTLGSGGTGPGAGTPIATIGTSLAANNDAPLTSTPWGLASHTGEGTATAYGTDITTGQAIGDPMLEVALSGDLMAQGGVCYIWAAAGTYDVSIQFKSTGSATVTVKNRRLYAWVVGF